MAYTLDIAISLPATEIGITDWNAQLVDTAGANVGPAITTGFVEIGSGHYLWHYAAFPDGHRGGVKFYRTADPATVKAFAAINPEEAENVDKKVSIGPLDTADAIEAGETLRNVLRMIRAVLAGVATRTGATTITTVFKRKDGTTPALTVEHDQIGNRTTSTPGTL